jgi:hypothetical protein
MVLGIIFFMGGCLRRSPEPGGDAPVTGASTNPIRSFAPMLVAGNLSHYRVYLIGPIGGAFIAVGFEWILRGRATRAGGAATQGILDQDNPSAL